MTDDVKPEDKPVIPADAINQNGQQSAEELAAQAAAEAAAAKAKEDAAAEDAAKVEADAKAKTEAEAAEKAKTDAKEKPLDLAVWETTGNEVGDAVLTKLQNSGVTPEEAKALLYDAVVAKDLTKIDKAALVAKVGEASATIILDGVKSFIADVEAANTVTLKAVHDVVGSSENWDAVRTWAKENLTNEQRLEYAAIIDISPKAAAMAAKAMYEAYISAGNTEFTSTSAVAPNVNSNATAIEPMTAAQYFQAVEKANKAGTYEADKGRLLQARLAGKKQGI